jgi:aconitate hydratase
VIAESFERIHRSNLVGMGVLPLEFKEGDGWEELGLNGSETFTVEGVETLQPRQDLTVIATRLDGTEIRFPVRARVDSQIELEYYRNGGILQYVLRQLAA